MTAERLHSFKWEVAGEDQTSFLLFFFFCFILDPISLGDRKQLLVRPQCRGGVGARTSLSSSLSFRVHVFQHQCNPLPSPPTAWFLLPLKELMPISDLGQLMIVLKIALLRDTR